MRSKEFQNEHGLPQIGAVGPATGALLISLAPPGCAADLPSAGATSHTPSTFNDPNELRSYPDCPLLVERDSGSCVERLQRDLNLVNSGYNLPQTGFFGAQTRAAVLDFQGRNRLPADGNVGGTTADLLAEQARAQSTQPGRPVDPAGSTTSNVDEVKVMTWNVKTRDLSDGSPSNWARVIGNQRPDLVALQEICESEVPELVAKLREDYELNYYYVLGGVRSAKAVTWPHLPYPGCGPGSHEYGQAILSQLPIGESSTVLLPKGDEEQRGYMRTEVRTRDHSGSLMQVFTTHIGFDNPAQQISALADAVQGSFKALVAGDFNLEPEDPNLAPLYELPLDEIDRQSHYPTVQRIGGDGMAKVDHIFFTGVATTSAPEVYDTPSSDHRPLISRFRVSAS